MMGNDHKFLVRISCMINIKLISTVNFIDYDDKRMLFILLLLAALVSSIISVKIFTENYL